MDRILRAHGLGHSYGRTRALDGVDLEVGRGECVALLGPNGAGKTTLVNLVIGLLRVQQGRVLVAGGDPRQATTRRHLGVMQQSMDFPPTLKVAELVTGAAVRGGKKRSAAGPVLAQLDLTELSGRRAARLSGGQKQRLQLAMALVNKPDLLVLDEPTAGFDPEVRRQFWQLIRALADGGTTILLTTHYLDEAEALADRVTVLSGGTVVAQGPPATLGGRRRGTAMVRWSGTTGTEERETDTPARLIGELFAIEGELPGLTVTRPSLEDTYLELIGQGA
ncbi:ABC transporter ATP-binding protein [Amycolatopsis cihanbeyliensis]|uniref:ABC-2 type transport system ATP-binding protein n=1 Tax=Amycolatopsis cihanbeyliensis TaxID=1128664 RepID=A0A542DK76_AMYCI|nr:ABC transporter ATP-binding protein [Amycolatopsis cihanbeyliensis]TQJ03499.1 ABC-2 type transport system ATP-binding protein [Amycolatopsis cihanbeyliensis]